MKNIFKLIEAKNIRFLAIAVLVSAIGFSMTACDRRSGNGGGSESGGSLTVTGIPAEYNGMEAGVSPRTTPNPFRAEDWTIISNRRVTISLVRLGYPVQDYNGNEIVDIEVFIIDSRTEIASARFDSVQFENGRATVDWSDRR